MKEFDIVVIGGGPAGLATAIAAKEKGVNSILIIERENQLGGILNQCIHNGFGLHTFKEELTGPEYAYRFIEKLTEHKISYLLNTMVLKVSKDKVLTVVNQVEGVTEIKAKAIVLSMGCRERPRGAINIPGSRCAGIFSAGTAQKLVNVKGYLPGREVVILGSGDIGLIMARRMTLEGCRVKAVVEVMPYSGGLKRNIVQCLHDYNIPLMLSHTVINIKGKERVEGATIAQVDNNRKPIRGTEEYIECDTLLLSVGLIPENELSKDIGVNLNTVTGGPIVDDSMQTNIEGVFACGNVLHVHDLVDYVTIESYTAGESAAKYISGLCSKENGAEIRAGQGISYVVPGSISLKRVDSHIDVKFRVKDVFNSKFISVYFDDAREFHIKKKIITPGEMEVIKLTKTMFDKHINCKCITIAVEEE